LNEYDPAESHRTVCSRTLDVYQPASARDTFGQRDEPSEGITAGVVGVDDNRHEGERLLVCPLPSIELA